MRFRVLSIPLALAVLSGCATTPLQTGVPAQSLGKGKIEAAMAMQGFAPANGGPFVVGGAFRGRYGLSDRWDLVAATELETLTVLAKWTWIEGERFRLAPIAGVALLAGDVSWAAGLVADVTVGPVTTYGVLRYQAVRLDATRLDRSPFAGVPPERFDFLSIALGVRVRVTDVLALAMETVVPFGSSRVRWDGGPFLATQMAFTVF